MNAHYNRQTHVAMPPQPTSTMAAAQAPFPAAKLSPTISYASNSNTSYNHHQPLNHRSRQSKKVTFASQSKGRIIPNLEEYTDRQKRRLWQTPDDKKSSQAEVAHIIRTVRRRRRNISAMSLSSNGDEPDDDDEICTRGLEHFCCKATLKNQVRRREALIDDVFYCQNSQWQAGNLHANDELLRRVSTVHSQADVDRAILLAAQDELIAKTMLRKEV